MTGKRQREVPAADDPYNVKLPPCTMKDHVRKNRYGREYQTKNCEHNPNCLYGLGERYEGIWQRDRLISRIFGDDPRKRRRTHRNANATASVWMHPCGLCNLGATCYLNSLVQCLFMVYPFRRAVYEWEPDTRAGATQDQIKQMRALQRLFALMQSGKESSYNPEDFSQALAIDSELQQDVQEFTKLLLAHLHETFRLSHNPSHRNLVTRLFEGKMEYVTKCQRCCSTSTRPTNFNDLSLHIKGHKKLEMCLAAYFSPELMDGDNKYLCNRCASKQIATRCMSVEAENMPPVLTLQLMRFVYDAHAGQRKKLMDVIEIGEELNVSAVLRQAGYETTGPDVVYRLMAYLNHRGRSADVGHYTASVAYPSENGRMEWFEFDDAAVYSSDVVVDVEQKTERVGKTIRSKDAYMLLYVCDDSAVRNGVVDSLETAQSEPLVPHHLRLEVDSLNHQFERTLQEYVKRSQELEARIQHRIQTYETLFVKERPYCLVPREMCYWVPTEWLQKWITGVEEREQKSVMEGGAEVVKVKKDKPMVAMTSETGAHIPFDQNINVTPYKCSHSSTDPCFAPEMTKKLKRVNPKFYTYLLANEYVQHVGSDSARNASARRIFSGRSYQCTICKDEFCNKILHDEMGLEETTTELDMLKVKSVTDDPEPYIISRAWVKSYKQHLTQEQRVMKQRLSTSKKQSQDLTTYYKDESDVPQWMCPINQDIICEHGNLTLDKKKYRSIAQDVWQHLKTKFPPGQEIKERLLEACAICEMNLVITQQERDTERANRNEILSNEALERLYRRDVTSFGRVDCMKDVFAFIRSNQAACNRKHCERMFMVQKEWMERWRRYIRDVDQTRPSVLAECGFMCPDGKMARPQSVLAVCNEQPSSLSALEVEFLSTEEMTSLVLEFGDISQPVAYCVLGGDGQVSWHRGSIDHVLKMDARDDSRSNGIYHDDSTVLCYKCEDDMSRQHDEALLHFQQETIHVRVLEEKEEVPSSTRLPSDQAVGTTRRSRRIQSNSPAIYDFTASASDDISWLKMKIYAEMDAEPVRQKLFYGGELVVDGKKLQEYHVKPGDVLYLRVAEELADIAEAIPQTTSGKEVGFETSALFGHHHDAASTNGHIPVWICSACTFVNENAGSECEICGTQAS